MSRTSWTLILNVFSFLAGLSACIASNPVDVVRTRMMVQRKTARYDLHHKITLAFASRSSLGLPVQSSYGETIPHTYFTSSLRCGLHTVFFVSLLMKLKASTGAVWGAFGTLQGLFPGICKDGTVECYLLPCLWETPEFLPICWQMRSQT